jgi:RsiW-degrading membrane proteinase PrsW (M82 family)
MNRKYLGIGEEPALGSAPPEACPVEPKVTGPRHAPDEAEILRDSITSEPALGQHADPRRWWRWYEARRAACATPGDLAVTLVAAILGGPAAVLGALLSGQQHWSSVFYAVVIAPVIEEFLKQSGMIYLLEKRPYRLLGLWQFLFYGAMAGLSFGVIENLIYLKIYAPLGGYDVQRMADNRWVVCTSLHVVCAMIGSLGPWWAWRKHLERRGPVEIGDALPALFAAMGLHAVYNFAATFLIPV